jgi:hypothetical protein
VLTLIDTSVWIDHWRGASSAAALSGLLEADDVLVHPWVLGELALGSLGPRRDAILSDLGLLPAAPLVSTDEVRVAIDQRRLAGSGIGWVDAALVASALVAGSTLWTGDRRLASIARSLGLHGRPR